MNQNLRWLTYHQKRCFPCANCRILLEATAVGEKTLLYFQNTAKFMWLAVGKNSITTVALKTEQTQPRSHWGGINLESQDAFYRSTLSWINTLWNEALFPLHLLCVDVMFLPGIRSFSWLFFNFIFGQLEKNQLLLSALIPTSPGTFLESLWLEIQLRVNDSTS